MTSALDPPPSRELFDVPEDIAYFNVANLAPHLHSVLLGPFGLGYL